MAAPVVVILAAGKGTRMRSSVPKLLHPICGRPMIHWPVAVARAAEASKIVVVDSPETPLAAHLDEDIVTVIQEQQLGTGDAVKAALGEISEETVVVLTGDTPLVRADSVLKLIAAHEGSGAAATVLTAVLDDPGAYGRVVRDESGHVLEIVEVKAGASDATAEQQQIREVNSGILVFSGALLADALHRVTNDNAQGEYYLPSVIPILRADGHRVAAHPLADPVEMWGVNDRLQLATVTQEAQRRIHTAHMLAGVTLINPASTVIDADVEIAADVVIEAGCTLRGPTKIDTGATIGPHSTLIGAEVGENSSVVHSYVNLAVIERDVSVGPFAYLRPGATLHDRSKAGTFVEIKNSDIGEGAKVPHLSYIGDADIGAGTNLGAATITANYDGVAKHRTTVGEGVFGGVDVTLKAPVRIGDGATTGAGSVITEDVPAGALAIARPRQTTIEGYAERSADRKKPSKERD